MSWFTRASPGFEPWVPADFNIVLFQFYPRSTTGVMVRIVASHESYNSYSCIPVGTCSHLAHVYINQTVVIAICNLSNSECVL